RFVQSAGWPALVKVCSRWFPPSSFGKWMAFTSLSFLFGDALARFYLGWMIDAVDGNWRSLFFISAGTLAGICVINFVLVKGNPRIVGLPEPEGSDQSFDKREGSKDKDKAESLKDLLLPIMIEL